MINKYIIFVLLLLITGFSFSQQGVKIAPTVGTPDPSAMLEIENGTDQKGVLITRVSLTNRTIAAPINTPANSLLVFNTNFSGNTFNDVQPGYYYWDTDSTKWIRLATSLGSDDQNIDSITLTDDELTIYIENGNSSNIDLSPIKDHDWYEVGTTASANSINDSIFTYGNVGIGTNSPTYILETAGANSDASINNIRVGRGGGDLITNTVVGNNALSANTTGNNNVAVGLGALSNNTTGIHNNAIGVSSLQDNLTGRGNVGVGINTLQSNTDGSFNIALGETALQYATSGTSNIGIGLRSLRNNITGSNNIGVGTDAIANSTGNGNIGIGQLAGFDVSASSNGTYIGNSIRGDFVGDNNIVIGSKNYSIAGPENTTALASSNSIFINANNGIERIRVNNLGDVGIGAFDPTHKLDVNGELRLRTIIDTLEIANLLSSNTNGVIKKLAYDSLVSYLRDSIKDADWYELGTTNSPTNINSPVYTLGDVGIGTTTPSNQLTVNGNSSIINGSLGFNRNPSTGALPTGGIANSGKFQVTYQSDHISLESYKQNSLTADGNLVLDTNGNVGIATTTPQGRLDVEASDEFYLGRNDANARIIASNGNNLQFKPPVDGNEIQFMDGNTNNSMDITVGPEATIQILTPVAGAGDLAIITDPAFGDDGDVIFRGGTASAERMRIKGSGKVGIGTPAPTQLLHVQGNEYLQDTLFVRDAIRMNPENSIGIAPDIWMRQQGYIVSEDNTFLVSNGNNDGSGDLIFSSGADVFGGAGYTEHMRVLTANGNVGINNTAPEEKLVVNGVARLAGIPTTDSTDTRIHLEIGTNPIGNNFTQPGSDRHFRILTETNYQTQFRDWMIFEAMDGNDPEQDGGFVFRSSNNLGAKNDVLIVQSRSGGRVGINTITPTEALHVTGNILASGTITPSDSNYKKNVAPLNNALEQTLKLRGVSYQMKEEHQEQGFGKGNQIGVIAQEVEKIYPELVRTNEEGYKGVDYSKFTPILIEAIKEQQEIIESLRNQNNQLSKDNDALKTSIENQNKVDDSLQKQIDELKEILNQTSSK